jgi:hypothetical protein
LSSPWEAPRRPQLKNDRLACQPRLRNLNQTAFGKSGAVQYPLSVVRIFQSSDVPLRTQAVVQQVLKTMAERIDRLGRV